MALTKCPECGKEVSDTATKCPNCGYKIKKGLTQETKLKIKKIAAIVVIVALIALVVLIILKVTHKEVIHGISWGMTPSQVEEQETKYSGVSGTYVKENNYYATSDTDFYNEDATILYMFENDKLNNIWIQLDDSSYENVYNVAVTICKEKGLPVSFEDNAKEDEPIPNSSLNWNIKGVTITLVGNYDEYIPKYYFSIKPYDGHKYGKKYKSQGTCIYGSKSAFPCKNEIVPWNEFPGISNEPRNLCYEHGCYVIGCPNGFANISDKVPLCMEHHYLCE